MTTLKGNIESVQTGDIGDVDIEDVGKIEDMEVITILGSDDGDRVLFTQTPHVSLHESDTPSIPHRIVEFLFTHLQLRLLRPIFNCNDESAHVSQLQQVFGQ